MTAQPESPLVLNVRTPEGVALGQQLARMCDTELAGKNDTRCSTCAFRAGKHLANGSPETLMTALKSALEGTPFLCHETEKACAGWVAMRAAKGEEFEVPWDAVEGRNFQAGDIIPLPDNSQGARYV